MGEWEHLQRNVGEWRGWFDSLDRTLQRTKRQPSLLTLKPAPSGVPLNLILLSLHEWLFQPLLVISAALFELRPLPWLLLAGLAWLMAGKPGKR